MAIISLTSIPPRFSGLGPVLDSLLAQSAKIDEIRLYIPRRYKRFPDWNGCLPDLPHGVHLIRAEDDFGPASKVLNAAMDLAGQETPILFCDDDRLYPEGWARGLLDGHAMRPGDCIATVGRHLSELFPDNPPCFNGTRRALIGKHYVDPYYRYQRLRQQWREGRLATVGPKPARRLVARAGHTEILLGYAGALILPRFVDAAFFDIPEDVWMVDDIWLSGNLARRRIPIYLPKRLEICRKAANDTVQALRDCQFSGVGRDGSNRRAVRFFQHTHGVWT